MQTTLLVPDPQEIKADGPFFEPIKKEEPIVVDETKFEEQNVKEEAAVNVLSPDAPKLAPKVDNSTIFYYKDIPKSELPVNKNEPTLINLLHFEPNTKDKALFLSADLGAVDKLCDITAAINELVQNTPNFPGFRPSKPDMLVMAKGSDDDWYRACTTSTRPNTDEKGKKSFKLFFFDYGFMEDVHEDNIRNMQEFILKMHPVIAVKCSLKGFDISLCDAETDNKIFEHFGETSRAMVTVVDEHVVEIDAINFEEIKHFKEEMKRLEEQMAKLSQKMAKPK